MSTYGWQKNVGLAEWLDLHHDQYPGWERDPRTGKPHTVVMTRVVGLDRPAYDIACEWDDVAEARFHWSEVPADQNAVFVRPGEMYLATFDFQTKTDRDRFAAQYGAQR